MGRPARRFALSTPPITAAGIGRRNIPAGVLAETGGIGIRVPRPHPVVSKLGERVVVILAVRIGVVIGAMGHAASPTTHSRCCGLAKEERLAGCERIPGFGNSAATCEK